MNGLRKQMGILAIAAASVTGGFFGYNFLENVQFAHAEQQVEATRQQLGTVEDMATVFRHVGKVVEPSVVKIEVTKTIKGGGNRMFGGDLNQLRRYFRQHGQQLPPNFQMPDDESSQPEVEMGTGSGVIMETADGYGYILTNNHVAGGADKMKITLADGRAIEDATLVGADPKSDIAVVKVKADRLIPCKWGNSDDLQKGDWVMAFGSPFGYVGSMTHGIVSALHRNSVGIIQGGYENFIQVDAPINPGNSGGPLVNIHGELVGVNTAIASASGGFQGIGFAVPANQAHRVYDALKSNGKVARGWLGVRIQDVSVDPDLAKSYNYTAGTGALVQETYPKTPAYGKLQVGDIVTAVNGKTVRDATELRTAIADIRPGDTAKLSVFRDGKDQDVSIKLADQPADMLAAIQKNGDNDNPAATSDSADDSASRFGLSLETLTPDLAREAKVTDTKSGAIITEVAPDSSAARKGIAPGDVITKVGNKTITSADDATAALSKATTDGVRLYVATKDGSRLVFLKPEKANTTKPGKSK